MAPPTTNPYNHYVPSVPAAVIAALIFAILTLAHVFLLFKSRKWFASAIVIGGLFEVVGFAARAVSHYHLDKKTPYIIQTLLILLAPILFAASVYMLLGRLMRAAGGQQYSLVRVNWLTKIFVLGDIFCFLVQAAGASMLVNAKTSDDFNRGNNIILGGLALQILFFILFIVTAVLWHVRMRSKPLWHYSASSGLHLGRTLWSLYIVGVLITVRNMYRLAEYKGGQNVQNGYLLSHEWPAYVLDAALMAIVMTVTLIWYSEDLRPKASEAAWNLQDV